MGHLQALNIVAKPNMRPVTSQDQKRFKLIIKLQEQLSMVDAELTGKGYKRMKWVARLNDQGDHERIQRPVRVKQWWFKDWAGNMFFAIRYGAKPIHIQKDKSAIKVANAAELPSVITALMRAVEAGELDVQLAAITNEHQFEPKRPTLKLPVKRN
jgi:hypothetical protein